MVNVEADALAGPLLARKAKAAGVVYSLAWGDQPALICEHVDWARACGFKVIAAGKGTRYEPHYHRSTPDTLWDILDKYLKIEDRSSINPKMFNSFVDGTKSGIEMTAVCNATGLVPQSGGLGFPPATRFELAEVCKPKAAGGTLEKEGVTEVVSSVYRDGRDVPHHLALGTYVVFEGESDYARRCFSEYAMLPDTSGRYAALYRPIHMIGLELGVSVASAALRREPTGAPTGFRSDVAATAKRALKKGEVLDGEGGFCVWGKQVPAERSLADGLLPLGLAHDVRLERDVAEGECLTLERRRLRRNRSRREGAPRDGGGIRAAECPYVFRNPRDANARARHLVAAVDGDQHRGHGFDRGRVADRPGVDAAQADILAQPDHQLARGLIVAANEHVAVDLVRRDRRGAAPTRSGTPTPRARSRREFAARRRPRTRRWGAAPRSPSAAPAARWHRPASCRRARREPPRRSPAAPRTAR